MQSLNQNSQQKRMEYPKVDQSIELSSLTYDWFSTQYNASVYSSPRYHESVYEYQNASGYSSPDKLVATLAQCDPSSSIFAEIAPLSEADANTDPLPNKGGAVRQARIVQAGDTVLEKSAVSPHTSIAQQTSHYAQRRREQNRMAQRAFRRRKEEQCEVLQDEISNWQQKHELLARSYDTQSNELQDLKKEIVKLNDDINSLQATLHDPYLPPFDSANCCHHGIGY